MDQFRESVKEYIKLDEQMKEMNIKLKQMREQKGVLTEQVVGYMIKNNIECCNVSDENKLVMKKQVQLGSINKDYITQTMEEFFKKPPKTQNAMELAQKTAETLLENRETNEKPILKVLKKK